MSLVEPDHDCLLCPRLVRYRAENGAAHGDWHNAPVPGFGAWSARLLIVGLAPGRAGANRTGRPFTGDAAGHFLYSALIAAGFATGMYDARPDDGLRLVDCRVTNAVRCAPPGNRPTAEEIRQCNRFLHAEVLAMAQLKCLLALGHIAHRAALRALKVAPKAAVFSHGATHILPGDRFLFDSYHCSRQNVATGRLTWEMFAEVLSAVRQRLDQR